MAIGKCAKCGDPNFDYGPCGCGTCAKCTWRQTCYGGGWFHKDEPIILLDALTSLPGPIIVTTGIIPRSGDAKS